MDQVIEFGEMIVNQLLTWYNNFTRNAIHMWDDMTLLKYIRLVAIVGAYALLRPYMMKWGEKIQAKQHEKELDPYEIATADAKAKGKGMVSPNDLRGVGLTGAGGKVVELEDSESEEETTGADVKWGKKARKRQRTVVKKILADQEEVRRQLQEDDEDKDIQEYLVDYTPGEDGW
jgi:protein trafficking PGA2